MEQEVEQVPVSQVAGVHQRCPLSVTVCLDRAQVSLNPYVRLLVSMNIDLQPLTQNADSHRQ